MEFVFLNANIHALLAKIIVQLFVCLAMVLTLLLEAHVPSILVVTQLEVAKIAESVTIVAEMAIAMIVLT